MLKNKKILIIGAGISGLTCANLLGNNNDVTIVQQRANIGGNCYDYYENGHIIHAYGAHLFHTNNQDVWKYISQFGIWHKYQHKVVASINGQYYNIPINITTINKFFNKQFTTKQEVIQFLSSVSQNIKQPKNAQQQMLSTIGKQLYQAFFKGYTTKQWDRQPKDLPAQIVKRIPIHYDTDDRYFTDKYQYMPSDGYSKLFSKMITNKNLNIKLNTIFKQQIISNYDIIISTGKIDQFFNYKYGKLQYRSVKFKYDYVDKSFEFPVCIVNFPSIDVNYTRILQLKHATQVNTKNTLLITQYPSQTGFDAYVINDQHNVSILNQYVQLAKQNTNIHFVGRLAQYKYYNMDQAIYNAMQLVERLNSEN